MPQIILDYKQTKRTFISPDIVLSLTKIKHVIVSNENVNHVQMGFMEDKEKV